MKDADTVERFRKLIRSLREASEREASDTEIARLRAAMMCPHCEGHGVRDSAPREPCNTCDGGAISANRGAEWAEKCTRLALEVRALRAELAQAPLGVPSSLAFIVPGPVVPWMRTAAAHSDDATAKPKRVTPKKQRDYQKHVASCAQVARMLAGKRYPALVGKSARLATLLRVFVTDDRRRDADNMLKTVLDACTRILWPDDSQVRRIYIDVAIDRENPRVEVDVGILSH